MRRLWRWISRLWRKPEPKIDAESVLMIAFAEKVGREIDREIVADLDLIGMDDHQPL